MKKNIILSKTKDIIIESSVNGLLWIHIKDKKTGLYQSALSVGSSTVEILNVVQDSINNYNNF